MICFLSIGTAVSRPSTSVIPRIRTKAYPRREITCSFWSMLRLLQKEGELAADAEEYKERIYDILEAKGLEIRGQLACEQVITPLEIADTFGAYRGALYGISANRKMDAFLRPSNFSKDIRNLSFVGGSTHPGGGSPMVTLSGMNVGEAVASRHRS